MNKPDIETLQRYIWELKRVEPFLYPGCSKETNSRRIRELEDALARLKIQGNKGAV